jgi:FtsZ-binding cell division protein ZapB
MTGLIDTLKDSLSPAARRRLGMLRVHLLPQPKRIVGLIGQVQALRDQCEVLASQLDISTSQRDVLASQLDVSARQVDALAGQLNEQKARFEEQVRLLHMEIAVLKERNLELTGIKAAHEERVTYLENHNTELTDAVITREKKLQEKAELDYQIRLLHMEIAVLKERNLELTGIKAAHEERVTYLENHNAELTDAVITREKKLQEKAELDYQILMTHQGLLAEFKDIEPRFQESFQRCKAFTMTSVERLYSLYKSVEYLVDASIPGDLAECGVWRGGSCMMMARALLASGSCDRRILLFDTFEGHPEPDPERDIDLWGNSGHDEWRRETSDGAVKGWGLASLDEVRENMQSTGYPGDKLAYIKGAVEETVPVNIPDRLGLLRLDTDWYESTRVALVHLYPRLVPGGVLILDDYGHYQGQRQAVDEYFAANRHRPLLHRIDYSCRVAVKLSP